jgi:hypothetical protein
MLASASVITRILNWSTSEVLVMSNHLSKRLPAR